MSRFLLLPFATLLVIAFAVGTARAEDAVKEDVKKPAPGPTIDSEEEVATALAEFKVAYKAKGLKGDERVMQRDFAMEQLAAYQHPKVVDALAKAMRGADENLRLSAVTHMARQVAIPVYAGKKVADALHKNRKDVAFLISGLATLGKLKYLGGHEYIEAGLKHADFGVKKAAIAAVGDTGDFRLMNAMLKEVGINAERAAEGGSTKEVVGESTSWDGAEAKVDTGSAGDGDQKAAEKAAKEQAAKNEAEATGGGSGGGMTAPGGSGGSVGGGGQRGKGGGGRSKKELIPAVKAALSKLTGDDLDEPKKIVEWLRANKKLLGEKVKELGQAEKDQKKDEKDQLKAEKGK